jgi:hypothetical protein
MRRNRLCFKVLRNGVELKPAATSGSQNGWRNLSLITYANYKDIRVFRLRPVSGAWTPPEEEVLIERSSLGWMGAQVGDTVLLETPSGKQRQLRIAGTVHDLTQTAASWIGRASGYVTPETMVWLGMDRGFDELAIIVGGDATNKDHVRAVTEDVRDKVETSGREVGFTWIPTPGKHPAAESIDPINMILGVLGLLSLVLSGFLVINNTMQAQLAQQMRQIGIMKAVGGQFGQIFGVYYAMVLAYAVLALAVGLPLGALAAGWMAGFMAELVNFDLPTLQPSMQVLMMELAVGLFVPVLAALWPILSAVRISAARAMSDYGMSNLRVKLSRRRPPAASAPLPDPPAQAVSNAPGDVTGETASGEGVTARAGPPEDKSRRITLTSRIFLSPSAAVAAQHLPPQGPGGPDPGHAGPGRCDVHCRLHGQRLC